MEAIEIDALFLANSIEKQGGLAYCMGAGWNRTWPANGSFPFNRDLNIAIFFSVPWESANQDHAFELNVRDSDRNGLVEPISGGFKTGRAAELTPGMSSIIVATLRVPVSLKGPGIYYIAIEMADRVLKQISFEVVESRPASG